MEDRMEKESVSLGKALGARVGKVVGKQEYQCEKGGFVGMERK